MNIQYKKSNGIKAIVLILCLIGLVALIIGLVLLFKTINFNNNSEKVEATVDSCEKRSEIQEGKEVTSYIIYVNYIYNGNHYEHILLSGINEQKAPLDVINININKNNPEDARYMTSTTVGVIILIALGVGFFGGMGYLFVIQIINENDYKDIVENGRKIQGVVTRIYPEKSAYNNKNQYYKLDCESMEKTFVSKPFKNGEDISEGDIVDIYYISLRNNKYYVDVKNIQIKQNKKVDNWTFK